MRIAWNGVGPWHKTGYGQQTDEFTRQFRDAGHEVVIAVFGEHGPRSPWNHPDAAEAKRTGRWDGMRVIGPGLAEFGPPPRPVIRAAFGGHDPDLVIILKDAWVCRGASYRQYNTALWLAFDTDVLGIPDRAFFSVSGARAVCVSTYGQRAAIAAGAEDGTDGLRNALYVPSGIDTGHWTPGDRNAARTLLGLPRDVFIAGICAQNIGPRKAWGEQFAAFAAYRRKDPTAMLLVHAAPEHPEGINLKDLRTFHGLEGAVLFGEHSNMDAAQMLTWYRSLNVLLAASYGEGFGLPIAEAMACGIPVIGTDCSAITEKIPQGCGWLIRSQPWWNPHHRANWAIPSVPAITAALAKAARGAHARPAIIREHALRYDATHVTKQHWAPALEELMR